MGDTQCKPNMVRSQLFEWRGGVFGTMPFIGPIISPDLFCISIWMKISCKTTSSFGPFDSDRRKKLFESYI